MMIGYAFDARCCVECVPPELSLTQRTAFSGFFKLEMA